MRAMRRPTPRLAVPLVALVLLAPTVAHGQTTNPGAAAPAAAQPNFRQVLDADPGVTTAVKDALRDGSAFLQPTAFGDLTGDGKSDAVVLVTTPGAAASTAAYVISAQGSASGRLRVLYRNQLLRRVIAKVSRGVLVLVVPDYAKGDDVCCPKARIERTYAYSATTRAFRRTSSQRFVLRR
jgi:hypothetical protein